MKNVRVDSTETLHYWSCGAAGFEHERTARSRVAFGAASLAVRAPRTLIAAGA